MENTNLCDEDRALIPDRDKFRQHCPRINNLPNFKSNRSTHNRNAKLDSSTVKSYA